MNAMRSAAKVMTPGGKKEHVVAAALDAFPWEEASTELQLTIINNESEFWESGSSLSGSLLASIPEESDEHIFSL